MARTWQVNAVLARRTRRVGGDAVMPSTCHLAVVGRGARAGGEDIHGEDQALIASVKIHAGGIEHGAMAAPLEGLQGWCCQGIQSCYKWERWERYK